MNIIGRQKEIKELDLALSSKHAEFVVIYGRRRVGKTFLVDEYFGYSYSFYATGIFDSLKAQQLNSFGKSLNKYSNKKDKAPTDWFDAFEKLIELLEDKHVQRDGLTGRRIIFFDELPWFDTPKSNFRGAFDWFWNSYASKQNDIGLIVCGSATSWIIKHLLASRGGFHNRVTREIYVPPFNLVETKELLERNGFRLSYRNIVDAYMVFGGIPYYLNLLNHRMSIAQNIDNLCFTEHGALKDEFQHLFASLFRHYKKHIKVIEALSNKTMGLLRNEISELTDMDGEMLTDVLIELEECGFIRKYVNYETSKNNGIYQIIDPFTLFALKVMQKENITSWLTYINTQKYFSWAGRSFEIVCLNNINLIKKALGIEKIESRNYAFISSSDTSRSQIDLLIDRRDDVTNLCEMKYSLDEYEINKSYEENLNKKVANFIATTKSKSSIQLTFITLNGVKKNSHSSIVQNEVTIEDLFKLS